MSNSGSEAWENIKAIGKQVAKQVGKAAFRAVRNSLGKLLIPLGIKAAVILFFVFLLGSLVALMFMPLTSSSGQTYFNFSNEPSTENYAANQQLVDMYKKVSLSTVDQKQAKEVPTMNLYQTPWGLFAAIDKLANNMQKPQPKVYAAALAPKFTFEKRSVYATIIDRDNHGHIIDQGNQAYTVKLIKTVNTWEGTYSYTYMPFTRTTWSYQNSLSTETITHGWAVKQITPPIPKDYSWLIGVLNAQGITTTDDIELAILLERNYMSGGQNQSDVLSTDDILGGGIRGAAGGGTVASGALGDTLAYADVISAKALEHGVSPMWQLADVAWESSGNWLALGLNQDANGNVLSRDAGLCQVNSANWGRFGLSSNPYDVNLNVNAGATILSSDLAMYGDMEDALYAYNGGTAANGREYNPGYAPSVEAKYNTLSASSLNAVIFNYSGNTATFMVAEKSTDGSGAVVNPSSITVEVKDNNGNTIYGPVAVPLQPGDGTVFSPQANLYKFTGPVNLQVGDVISVKTNNELVTIEGGGHPITNQQTDVAITNSTKKG